MIARAMKGKVYFIVTFLLLAQCWKSVDSAKKRCIDTYNPSSVNVCKLPKAIGPCRAATTRYYFNVRSGKCENFKYGGCRGNANNFRSLQECKMRCSQKDACQQPKYVGPCRGRVPRYYFNQEKGTCEKFYYGGCRGNNNNFESISDCNNRCPSIDVCKLPKEVGACKAAKPRYYFNVRSGKCEMFIYSGCQGNANNFMSLDACENRCTPAPKDACQQPKVIGPCRGRVPRYYFNQEKETCEKFYYGGCRGNENNFQSMLDCNKRCDQDCPRGNKMICLRSACENARCPRQSGAKCDGFCNGCVARFFDRFGNEVTENCQCNTGVSEAICREDPCRTATCHGYPADEVQCRANYCGGCNAVFYNRQGNEVECKNPRCPPTPPGIITPCDVSCFGDDSCPNGQICCSYGCSIRCVYPFPIILN